MLRALDKENIVASFPPEFWEHMGNVSELPQGLSPAIGMGKYLWFMNRRGVRLLNLPPCDHQNHNMCDSA
jgi:hypothetical protein